MQLDKEDIDDALDVLRAVKDMLLPVVGQQNHPFIILVRWFRIIAVAHVPPPISCASLRNRSG